MFKDVTPPYTYTPCTFYKELCYAQITNDILFDHMLTYVFDESMQLHTI